MTDYVPDPFKNYKPRQNPANIVVTGGIEPQLVIAPSDLTRLEKMGREELVVLIQKVCAAGWGSNGLTGSALVKTALQSEEDTYQALMLKGSTLALHAKEWKEFKELATFWAERVKGKPTQLNAITTDDNTLTLAEMIIGAHKMGKPKILDVTPEKDK